MSLVRNKEDFLRRYSLPSTGKKKLEGRFPATLEAVRTGTIASDPVSMDAYEAGFMQALRSLSENPDQLRVQSESSLEEAMEHLRSAQDLLRKIIQKA